LNEAPDEPRVDPPPPVDPHVAHVNRRFGGRSVDPWLVHSTAADERPPCEVNVPRINLSEPNGQPPKPQPRPDEETQS
jgi:hypothetical protein